MTENINQKDEKDKTSLMTLHSAKGLEFDYVFLPGWEEGIFLIKEISMNMETRIRGKED